MFYEPEYETVNSDGISISACQAFLEDDGDGCGYYVRIENNSDKLIRILGKDFRITDEAGNNFFNNDPGFNGEIPELRPGEYFEYADSTPFSLNFGVLYGSCRIASDNAGAVREIKIPAVQMVGNKTGSSMFN